MKRILIIGSPGSGKSTLATQLGTKLGSSVVHLDQIYWLPGWELRPKQEAYDDIAKLAQGDRWIMEGNWFDSMPPRIARADALIFVDLPAWQCVTSIIRRILQTYGRVRKDMAPGCPEQFDFSFLQYTWNYPKDGRLKALELTRNLPDHVNIYHLRSRNEVAHFLMKATA